MPKVRIRKIPTHLFTKDILDGLRDYWGDEPLTVYGYSPNGHFIVWDQQIADWGFLRTDYCVPCE
jgi:hypothetical protein